MSCKNSVATFALALSLGLSVASPAAAKTPEAVGQAFVLPSIGIDNFGQVNAHYYRGAQPQGQDFAALARLGVKLVIDLAGEGDSNERANTEREGMRFVRIPMTTSDRPSQAVIDQFLALVNDPANQPVYVHCVGGRHRTGVMTAVYRMTQDGWTADRAFSEMKQYKFGADFLHPALKTFVFDFFSQLSNAKAVPKQAANARSAS